ncbi:MAG: hypothetical protein JNM61_01630 [Zoogloeaceae bacterium]|nr:hypothetical protein [Zoogloeaceae bacterium]
MTVLDVNNRERMARPEAKTLKVAAFVHDLETRGVHLRSGVAATLICCMP